MLPRVLIVLGFAAASYAQTVCQPTPEFTPCDVVFDIPSVPGSIGPINLDAEFRSPNNTTGRVKAFWDGGTKWVVRYTAAEPGNYVWHTIGNAAGLGGKEGQFTATPVNKPGWLRAANTHHFAFVD